MKIYLKLLMIIIFLSSSYLAYSNDATALFLLGYQQDNEQQQQLKQQQRRETKNSEVNSDLWNIFDGLNPDDTTEGEIHKDFSGLIDKIVPYVEGVKDGWELDFDSSTGIVSLIKWKHGKLVKETTWRPGKKIK